jgi:hypothetical protein
MVARMEVARTQFPVGDALSNSSYYLPSIFHKLDLPQMLASKSTEQPQ